MSTLGGERREHPNPRACLGDVFTRGWLRCGYPNLVPYSPFRRPVRRESGVVLVLSRGSGGHEFGDTMILRPTRPLAALKASSVLVSGNV